MDKKQLAEAYEDLRAQKEDLEEQLKKVKEQLTEAEEAITDYMIEEDEPQFIVGQYSYSLKNETKYNFLGAEKLLEKGLDKFEVLRENGFDFLIKETVDPRTLSSTMKEVAASDEGIPDEVMEILSAFDVQGVSRRKASRKQLETLAKAKEARA